jgi:hypothetical protein
MHEILRLHDMFPQIVDWSDFDLLVREQAARRRESAVERSERPAGEVNASRWIVRCPRCGNAMPGDPDWEMTGCLDCGAFYRPVYPPRETVVVIEAVLAMRPSFANRHWVPDETIDALIADNEAHGLGVS